MWSFGPFFILAVIVERSHALVVRGTRFQSRDQTNGVTLHSIADDGLDLRYTTNLTVNGQNFNAIIDTGSSDIWVIPPADFTFDNTGIPILAPFGGGNVSGVIGFGTVGLGSYTVQQQVFQNATFIDVGLVEDLGINALIGLAFESTQTSPLTATLEANGSNPIAGNPFLYNIFAQTPGQDNFVGISLSRTDDLEGTADASFTINELDPTYAGVVNAPTIPVVAGIIDRWRILVDNISVNGVNVPFPSSALSNAPAGSLVTILDTGTPTAAIPAQVISSVFSQIPGAVFKVVDGLVLEGSPIAEQVWTVPCNTTTIVSVGMGGQSFPIHPLDLSAVFINNVTNVATCVSQWSPGPANPDDFDMIFGDSFMRNFYTVFNFGDDVSQAPAGSSIQLLSQTNPTSAQQDVAKVRTAQIAAASSAAGAPAATAAGGGPAATSPATKHSGQPRLVVSRCILFLFTIFAFALQ
ncbi:aspartic peptidase domain-containing protein [Mycena maculata]|uniref:Aspartic peptidase domain-containing protein n=1 Tax=Mycena maculata TaxID=230809 RepID=A0AAD7KGE3_9AGAR|nr:aspartic peptidase domain-containing protein [Mycena maculata]